MTIKTQTITRKTTMPAVMHPAVALLTQIADLAVELSKLDVDLADFVDYQTTLDFADTWDVKELFPPLETKYEGLRCVWRETPTVFRDNGIKLIEQVRMGIKATISAQAMRVREAEARRVREEAEEAARAEEKARLDESNAQAHRMGFNTWDEYVLFQKAANMGKTVREYQEWLEIQESNELKHRARVLEEMLMNPSQRRL